MHLTQWATCPALLRAGKGKRSSWSGGLSSLVPVTVTAVDRVASDGEGGDSSEDEGDMDRVGGVKNKGTYVLGREIRQ